MQSTIITINKDGIVQSVDKNCCRLFGYDLEELVGGSVKRIIPAPYKEQHDSYMSNYLRTGVPKIIGKSRIVEGQHKDGNIFPIRLSVSRVGEGDSIIFIGMIDKMEDKSASVTINVDGNVVSCNQNIEDIFGFRPNEVIGNNVKILMPQMHAHRHDQYIKDYMNGGEAKVIGKVRNVAAKHKNGTVFPVSLQVEQLKIGPIVLFRGKIERVDTMEAVFTIDGKGKIVGCNLNFVIPLCGYNTQDLMGQNISILFPGTQQLHSGEVEEDTSDVPESPIKRQKLESHFSDRSLSDSWKTAGVHRKMLRHKDGSVFPIDLEICPFRDENGVTLFSGKIKRSTDLNDSSELDGQKFIGDYVVVKTVGQGSYGKVKLAHHKDTKKNYAIKILQKAGMKSVELERARRETDILKKLDHPHIARLYEVIETSTTLNFVMEYAESTLLNFVLERNGLGEEESKKFFKQIISAVKYCHDMNIIHRDLKHQNLLLDAQGNTKLIDFGLSNFMEEGRLRSTFCGTPAYAAPEMILGKKYVGPEVDIWSLGVVLYSMITGVFPFENVSDIIKGHFTDPKGVSKDCCHLIRQMLDVDINRRINIDGVVNHPWVLSLSKPQEKPIEVEEVECTIVTTMSQAHHTQSISSRMGGLKTNTDESIAESK